jgi:hypothetical protein
VRLLRLCFVDMPVPEVPWLIEEPGHANDSVAIRATRRSGSRTAIR